MKAELIELLKGGSAHVSILKVFENVKPEIRNRVAEGTKDGKTLWQLLEHMRIAQEDIIRYTLDEGWESAVFPDGYWPQSKECTDAQWNTSLNSFRGDLEYLIKFINSADFDLTTLIPHGEGRSYLREILLVADHNAYHAAQAVDIRKRLGDWN
ncbi:MAG: hypothetical protein SCALA702_05090 [Melioribacteraceae bacterium]|nr:MAG: hypothetical protein SCALA702_05090 [Melioribacteraceae bacterium]